MWVGDDGLQGFLSSGISIKNIFAVEDFGFVFSFHCVFLLLSGDLGGFEDLLGGIFAVEALEV